MDFQFQTPIQQTTAIAGYRLTEMHWDVGAHQMVIVLAALDASGNATGEPQRVRIAGDQADALAGFVCNANEPLGAALGRAVASLIQTQTGQAPTLGA